MNSKDTLRFKCTTVIFTPFQIPAVRTRQKWVLLLTVRETIKKATKTSCVDQPKPTTPKSHHKNTHIFSLLFRVGLVAVGKNDQVDSTLFHSHAVGGNVELDLVTNHHGGFCDHVSRSERQLFVCTLHRRNQKTQRRLLFVRLIK